MLQAGYHVIFLHRARSIQPFAAAPSAAELPLASITARLGRHSMDGAATASFTGASPIAGTAPAAAGAAVSKAQPALDPGGADGIAGCGSCSGSGGGRREAAPDAAAATGSDGKFRRHSAGSDAGGAKARAHAGPLPPALDGRHSWSGVTAAQAEGEGRLLRIAFVTLFEYLRVS